MAYRKDLLAFVEADLAAVNRSKTPWLLVTSHYPFYETGYIPPATTTETSYLGEPDFGARGSGLFTNDTIAPSQEQAIADLEHMFLSSQVDMFLAGHNHNSEWTYPMKEGKEVAYDYKNPTAPVHVLSGAAGKSNEERSDE